MVNRRIRFHHLDVPHTSCGSRTAAVTSRSCRTETDCKYVRLARRLRQQSKTDGGHCIRSARLTETTVKRPQARILSPCFLLHSSSYTPYRLSASGDSARPQVNKMQAQAADSPQCSLLANWTKHNVVLDFGPLVPLCEKMTSSP